MTQPNRIDRPAGDLYNLLFALFAKWSFVIAWTTQTALALLALVFVSNLATGGMAISPFVSTIFCVVSIAVLVTTTVQVTPQRQRQVAVSIGSLSLLNVLLWSICVASSWMLIPLATAGLFLVSLVAIGFPGLLNSKAQAIPSSETPAIPRSETSESLLVENTMTVPLELYESQESEIADESLLQSFYRSITEDGETINGSWKIVFGQGQKSAVVHVPFWPPVDRISQVECETIDAENCDVKATNILANGLRFEVKRKRGNTTDQTVTFEWSAILESQVNSSNFVSSKLVLKKDKEAL